MKLAVAIVGFGLCAGAARAQVRPPFQLSAEPSGSRLHAGEELRLKIVVTNTSNGPITFVETNPECDYRIEVRDNSHGQGAAPTEHGRTLECDKRAAVGRAIQVTLEPNETREDELSITRLFVLSPDSYSITVSRTIQHLSNTPAKAPSVHVTVVP